MLCLRNCHAHSLKLQNTNALVTNLASFSMTYLATLLNLAKFSITECTAVVKKSTNYTQVWAKVVHMSMLVN